jgi:transcriptional regulator with XRE-family HTH domain
MLAALGRRVREARVRRGLTQLDLAQAAELSVAYVSLIERGGRNPPLTTVVSLARALGVGVTELVT